MKRAMFFLFLCGILVTGPAGGCAKPQKEGGGKITVSGAFALYPMVVKWSEEYRKLHPEIRIDVSAGGAGKGMADALTGAVDIGMISREVHKADVEKGAWWISVVKDSVVPVANSANPVAAALRKKGVKKEIFKEVWMDGKIKTWGEIAGAGESGAVQVYTRSDSCGAAETWAKFLDGKQENMLGENMYGDPGILEAVRKDKSGIGFNNIAYVFDPVSRKPVDGLMIIPIDLNGDGKIDDSENFYSDRDLLSAAIADGRFPSPPARKLLLVTKGKPQSRVVRDFLIWTLTDGQKFVEESGYVRLLKEDLATEIKKLEE